MDRSIELRVGNELLELEISGGTTAGEVVAVLVRRNLLAADQAYFLEHAGRRLDQTQRLDDLDLGRGRDLQVVTASGVAPQLLPPDESVPSSETEGPSVELPETKTEDPTYEGAFQTLRKLRMVNRGLLDFRVKDPDKRIFQVFLKYRTSALYKTPRGELPTVMIGNEVEVYVTLDYPRHSPVFVWASRIFHPNIVAGEEVRLLGRTAPGSLTLEEGLRRLVEMLQYKKDWYRLEPAANKQAAQWAADNRHLFPLGEKSLITELPVGEIEEEAAAEADLLLPEEPLPPEQPSPAEEEPSPLTLAKEEAEELPPLPPDSEMAEKVLITLQVEGNEIDVRLPVTTPFGQLAETILLQLSMPTTDEAGEAIHYTWVLDRTGQQLEDLSLAVQGIVDGDVIVLTQQGND